MKHSRPPRFPLVAATCLVAGALSAFDCSDAAKAKARDFIDNEKQFHLGFLPTEQSNPITATLEEDFKRSTPAERALAERSASIMTGGDFALIKSVESFEDSMPGGERQAAALNIGEGDTFVATDCTDFEDDFASPDTKIYETVYK